jgi:hypothetical protein
MIILSQVENDALLMLLARDRKMDEDRKKCFPPRVSPGELLES